MKRNFKVVLATILTLVTLLPSLSFAEYLPSVTTRLDIDGDVISGYSQNITPSITTTSSDWFKPNVNGITVIKTTRSEGFRTWKPFFNSKIKKDAY